MISTVSYNFEKKNTSFYSYLTNYLTVLEFSIRNQFCDINIIISQ